jgi:hypothetical protein
MLVWKVSQHVFDGYYCSNYSSIWFFSFPTKYIYMFFGVWFVLFLIHDLFRFFNVIVESSINFVRVIVQGFSWYVYDCFLFLKRHSLLLGLGFLFSYLLTFSHNWFPYNLVNKLVCVNAYYKLVCTLKILVCNCFKTMFTSTYNLYECCKVFFLFMSKDVHDGHDVVIYVEIFVMCN